MMLMIKILFCDIRDKNLEFLNLLTEALQFNKHILSIIPSLVFLIFSMVIIYRATHRNAPRFRRNSYRDALYREIAFQWLYLYITRAWLYVVKALRLATKYLENLVLDSGGSEKNVYFVHISMFFIYILLSITPFLLIATIFGHDETTEQNILFWIPPNRWTRSELGSAGRLMERPPEFVFTNSKFPPAYETKRSVSLEISKKASNIEFIRYCKSGCLPDQVSSFEELIHTD